MYRKFVFLIFLSFFISIQSNAEATCGDYLSLKPLDENNANFQSHLVQMIEQVSKTLRLSRWTSLKVLTIENYEATKISSLKRLPEGSGWIMNYGSGDQIISAVDILEAKTLEKTFSTSKALEVLTIRAHRFNGESVNFGKFYVGDNDLIAGEISVRALNDFYDDFFSVYNERFFAIEFIHSHPGVEIAHDSGYIIHPLSSKDMNFAKILSEDAELRWTRVIITAVLVNGYSHKAVYMNGENITACNGLKQCFK